MIFLSTLSQRISTTAKLKVVKQRGMWPSLWRFTPPAIYQAIMYIRTVLRFGRNRSHRFSNASTFFSRRPGGFLLYWGKRSNAGERERWKRYSLCVTAGFSVQNEKSQIVLNTSINSISCVPFSILPMIYRYFWRVRLAKPEWGD